MLKFVGRFAYGFPYSLDDRSQYGLILTREALRIEALG